MATRPPRRSKTLETSSLANGLYFMAHRSFPLWEHNARRSRMVGAINVLLGRAIQDNDHDLSDSDVDTATNLAIGIALQPGAIRIAPSPDTGRATPVRRWPTAPGRGESRRASARPGPTAARRPLARSADAPMRRRPVLVIRRGRRGFGSDASRRAAER